MSMSIEFRGAERPHEIALSEWGTFFREILTFHASGVPSCPCSVRPLADSSAESWPGLLDAAMGAPQGAVVGLVSERAGDAAFLACTVASWIGSSGRTVVVVDGSVEFPSVEKALIEHGDEGLVDAVLFGVSPSAAAKRTLTANVRVMTAGSHPLSVESVLSGPGLGRVLRGLGADLVLLILPLAHLKTAGPSLDTVVAVAREQATLEDVALTARDAGISGGVAVLLMSTEAQLSAGDLAATEREETGIEPTVPEEGQQSAESGDAEEAPHGPESRPDEETVVTAEEAPARRNEFIRPTEYQSPYLEELPPEPRESIAEAAKPRVRLGFIGWLALAAIVVIVGLVIFDMTLKPGRLAWEPGPATEPLEESEQAALSTTQPDEVPPAVEGTAGEEASESTAPGQRESVERESEAGAPDGALEATADRRPESSVTEDVSPPVAPATEGDAPVWMEDAPPAGELEAALTGSGGPYVVMLSSQKLRSAAEWEAAEAESQGIPVHVVEAQIQDRGTWYRVVLDGGHPTLASARAALDIVKELGYEGAWLTRVAEDG